MMALADGDRNWIREHYFFQFLLTLDHSLCAGIYLKVMVTIGSDGHRLIKIVEKFI